MRIANCIESFSFHEQNQNLLSFPLKIIIKSNIQWSKKRPHKKLETSSPSTKGQEIQRVEHIPVQENRSDKQMETRARRSLLQKGGPVFPRQVTKTCMLYCEQERCDESQISSKFLGTVKRQNLKSTELQKRI